MFDPEARQRLTAAIDRSLKPEPAEPGKMLVKRPGWKLDDIYAYDADTGMPTDVNTFVTSGDGEAGQAVQVFKRDGTKMSLADVLGHFGITPQELPGVSQRVQVFGGSYLNAVEQYRQVIRVYTETVRNRIQIRLEQPEMPETRSIFMSIASCLAKARSLWSTIVSASASPKLSVRPNG